MCNKNKYLAREYSETKDRTGTDRERVMDRFRQPRRELTEKRTLNSKTFENEDHTFTTSIYMDPVHYLDTDGTWKDATDDLVEAPGIPEPAAGIQVLETENGEKAAPAGMHETRSCYVNRKGSWKASFLKRAAGSFTSAMTTVPGAKELFLCSTRPLWKPASRFTMSMSTAPSSRPKNSSMNCLITSRKHLLRMTKAKRHSSFRL